MRRKDKDLLNLVKKKKKGGFVPFQSKVAGGNARRRADRKATGGVTPAPEGGAVKQKFQAGGDVSDEMKERGKRYLAARMNVSEGPITTKGRDDYVNTEYDRARKATGLQRKAGGHISAAGRRALPSSDFALPGKGKGPEGKGSGSYPIDTPGRARSALSRGAANASPAEQATIRAKVKRKYPSMNVSS